MSLIGVRELRQRTSEVIRRVREDGAEYVLKVANATEARTALDLQNRAMAHVAAKATAARFLSADMRALFISTRSISSKRSSGRVCL